MNHLKYYAPQFIALALLFAPGLLEIFGSLMTSFEERTVTGLPKGLATHPWVVLPVIQYLLITTASVIILITSHTYVASKVFQAVKHVRQTFFAQLLWGLVLWFSVLVLNTIFFPHSKFANTDLSSLIDTGFVGASITIVLFATFILLPVGFYIASALVKLPRTFQKVAVFLFCGLSALYFVVDLFAKSAAANPQKPNIFIIGIDSLRPELIPEHMPFLNEQLATAKKFPNSYTPFARTYPAWMSILTGRYPHSNGARFNLSEESQLAKDNHYLPHVFQQYGYQTLYGADERRFSNLGKTQGFESVVGPATGVRDFILGAFADFPTSNLMLKLPFAHLAFPEIYGNRAAHRLYYPEQFSDLLESSIANLDNKPVFMAVHFCLPHWPYLYANHQMHDDYEGNTRYPQNLKAVDKQIQSFFTSLQDSQRLENSILVFLSDHGESWGNAATGLNLKDDTPLYVTDFGHGMNILSQDSHKILLALKTSMAEPTIDNSLRSLVDIAPTLYQLTNITAPDNLDGLSLLDPAQANRPIYFESGIVMAEANQETPDEGAVAAAGIRHFRITDQGLLRVKQEAAETMLQQKQLGVRTLNSGLYFGQFSDADHTKESMDKSLLYTDFKAKHFSIPSTDELNKSEAQLFSAFCQAFQNVNESTQDLCTKSNSNP